MVDQEAKKILAGKWAESGDRVDPEDPSLTPVLVRDTGWTASFSATDTPRRAVFNQRFRELDGIAVDTMLMGVLPWDDEINYLAGAVVNEAGVLYSADVDTGPDSGNATDPSAAGQTVWTGISGQVSEPNAPDAPIGVTDILGQIGWYWDCPLDGGAEIDQFDFQWREAGQTAWSASIVTDYARHILAVAGSSTIEAQVRARNLVGNSPWSAVGSADAMSVDTPAAPQGLAGEPEQPLIIDWAWNLVTDTGGAMVTSYDFQWRPAGTSQWTSLDVTQTYARMTAPDDRDIEARVRARNSAGAGSWSGIVTVTPIPADVPIVPPADTAPSAPARPDRDVIDFETILWRWTIPDDDGGQPVTGFEYQRRFSGDPWGNVTATDQSCFLDENLDDGRTYNFRVRAVNSVGTSSWSLSTSGTTPAEPPPPPADTAPNAPSGLTGTPRRPLVVDWDWDLVTDDGGDTVDDYEFQWRLSGQTWSGNVITVTGTHASITLAATGTAVQARVRARNSVGSSNWSSTVTVAASSLLGTEFLVVTGMISPFTGAAAPTGWALCDGAALSRTANADLFAVIGETWGDGDGSSTFNVPNLARRTLVGAGGSSSSTLGSDVGDQGGAERVTLTQAQMPAHTHSISGANSSTGSTGDRVARTINRSSTDPINTQSAGSGSSHSNIQPSAVVNYIIKL